MKRTKNIIIRVDEKIHEKVKLLGKEEGRGMSEIVRALLSKWIMEKENGINKQ